LVAKSLNISEDEVIKLHTANDYWIFINGAIAVQLFSKALGDYSISPEKNTRYLLSGRLHFYCRRHGSAFKSMDGQADGMA